MEFFPLFGLGGRQAYHDMTLFLSHHSILLFGIYHRHIAYRGNVTSNHTMKEGEESFRGMLNIVLAILSLLGTYDPTATSPSDINTAGDGGGSTCGPAVKTSPQTTGSLPEVGFL